MFAIFKKHGTIVIFSALLIIAALTWRFALARSGELTVDVFDVGQGDAIFFSLPDGTQGLIDGGPDGTVLSELSAVMPPWDHSIDLVMATHPEADHLAGLLDVLARYDVAIIVETGIRKETAISKAWDAAVAQEGAKTIIADRPKRIAIGDSAALDLLWPQESHAGEILDTPNNYAVVSRLMYGDTSFLFTADIERWAEDRIVATIPVTMLHSDALKVAHHGSKTSSSENFLRAVTPSLAVISVGADNRYGHPVPSVLVRLAQAGIPVFRTDQQGRVEIRSDGHALSVDTKR